MNLKFKLLLKMLLGIVIVVISFVFVSLLVFLLISGSEPISKIEDYTKCIKMVQNKEKIAHFPKIIPSNVKAQLYCYPARYDGQGELVILRLTTDKTYIENELKAHTFLNSQTLVGTVQNIYNMPTDFVGISNKDVTFYVLKNEDNEYFYEKYFPYFTGIGVDKNLENIVYYYIEPDD